MLFEAYSYAISKRDSILQNINAERIGESLAAARGLWVPYTPALVEQTFAGIDSSWNFVPYHGFYLYAVEAVSICKDESFTCPAPLDVGLSTLEVEEADGGAVAYNPRLRLQSIGMEYEYSLAKQTLKERDFALIDGSVLARFYDRRKKRPMRFFEYAEMLMKQERVVFVAKTSESNVMIHGPMGDIFYFSRAGTAPGYSRPYYDPIGVSVFYARLAEFAPCLRVEVPGRVGDDEARRTLDVLGTNSFNGYPYVLRLAHQRCCITNDDMSRLADVLGLEIEGGGREVLQEAV